MPARPCAPVHQIAEQLRARRVRTGRADISGKRKWIGVGARGGRGGSHKPWSVGRPPRARTPLALCKAQPQGKAIAAAQGPGNHTHLPANRNVWAI